MAGERSHREGSDTDEVLLVQLGAPGNVLAYVSKVTSLDGADERIITAFVAATKKIADDKWRRRLRGPHGHAVGDLRHEVFAAFGDKILDASHLKLSLLRPRQVRLEYRLSTVNLGHEFLLVPVAVHQPQQRAAEREYLGMLDVLETQLGSTRYALGDRPSAVDTIVLGGLRAHTNADPIPDLSGYTRVLEWEAECENGWDGKGDLAPFPDSTPFAQHMLELTRDQYTKFVSANGKALAAGDKVFQIETYGEETTYLAREYPERSRRILQTHAYDPLSQQERSQVLAWLETKRLTDILIEN